jgi:hypothetical protein
LAKIGGMKEKEKRENIWKKLFQAFPINTFVKEEEGFNWMTLNDKEFLKFNSFVKSNFNVKHEKNKKNPAKLLQLKYFSHEDILKLFQSAKTSSLEISEILENLPDEIKGKKDKNFMILNLKKICQDFNEIFQLKGTKIFLNNNLEIQVLDDEFLVNHLMKKLKLNELSIYKNIKIKDAFGWMNKYEMKLISGGEDFISFLKRQKNLIVTKDEEFYVRRFDPVVEKYHLRILEMFSEEGEPSIPYKKVLKEMNKIQKIKSPNLKQLLKLNQSVYEKKKKFLSLKSENVSKSKDSSEDESESTDPSEDESDQEEEELGVYLFSISFKYATKGVPVEFACAKINQLTCEIISTFHELINVKEPSSEMHSSYLHNQRFINGLPCCKMSKEAKTPLQTIWKRFLKFIHVENRILFSLDALGSTESIHYICKQLDTKNTLEISGFERFFKDLPPKFKMKNQALRFLDPLERCGFHKPMNPLFECALEDACSVAKFMKIGSEKGFNSFLIKNEYCRPSFFHATSKEKNKIRMNSAIVYMLKHLNPDNYSEVKKNLVKIMNSENSKLLVESIFEIAHFMRESKEFLELFDVLLKQKSFENDITCHCLDEIEVKKNLFNFKYKKELIENIEKEFIKNVEFVGEKFKDNQSLNDEISKLKELVSIILESNEPFDEIELSEAEEIEQVEDYESTDSEDNLSKDDEHSDKDVYNEVFDEVWNTDESPSVKEEIIQLDLEEDLKHSKIQISFLNEEFIQNSEKIKEEINALVELLPRKYVEVLYSEDLNHLIEVEMDFNRTPKAHFFKNRIVKLSKDLVTMEEIQQVTGKLKILPNNRSGIEKHLHRISVIKSSSNEIIGVTLRIGKPFYGISNALKDILDSKKSILFLGRPGCGKTSEKNFLINNLRYD